MEASPPTPASAASNLVVVRATPFNAETPPGALRPAITPTAQHYVRSNFAVPAHDGRLRITGAVARPLTLTVAELQDFPATTLTVTLECAGNNRVAMLPLPTGEPWTGGAVGTATWTGVPLALLLEQARPSPEAVEVAFAGADHGPYKGEPDVRFERSLPLAVAQGRAAAVLLAYAMNGAPLPPAHGAPLRLIVPGWYGMASVKWLQTIEVRGEPFAGTFQTHSYVYNWAGGGREPVTRQRVKALIVEPVPGTAIEPGEHQIRGKAWSGAGAVTRVEVSIDAGAWQPAELGDETGPHGWRAWSVRWDVQAVGRHALRTRAFDAAGNAQPEVPPWNALGYGNNAVQPILIDVRCGARGAGLAEGTG